MGRAIVLGASILLIAVGALLVLRTTPLSSGMPSASVQRRTGFGAMLLGVARFLPDTYALHDLAFFGGCVLFLYGALHKRSAEPGPPAV